MGELDCMVLEYPSGVSPRVFLKNGCVLLRMFANDCLHNPGRMTSLYALARAITEGMFLAIMADIDEDASNLFEYEDEDEGNNFDIVLSRLRVMRELFLYFKPLSAVEGKQSNDAMFAVLLSLILLLFFQRIDIEC